MRLYFLSEKSVVLVSPKAAEFMKNYSTNTTDAPQNAFVDLKGRIVALCEQKKLSDNEMLLILDNSALERLQKHLKAYLFLTGTSFTPTEYRAYFEAEGKEPISPDDYEIRLKQGRILLSKKTHPTSVSDNEFKLFRVLNKWPIQGIDFQDELLLNIGNEEYVNYEKGCYLGQEIIARVHYKGKAPKTLESIILSKVEASERARATSVVHDPSLKEDRGLLLK